MIYGRKFNIVHMPKTGGTWLRRVCEKIGFPVIDSIYPHHKRYWELEGKHAHKATYLFVRNPWDWYVSLYHHKHTNIEKKRYEFSLPFDRLDLRHQIQYRRFAGTFAESLQFVANWNNVPDHHTTSLNYMGTVFEDFRRKPSATAKAVEVLKYEDGVRASFLKVLEKHEGSVASATRDLIAAHPLENRSESRKGYRHYYTPELRALVEKQDAAVIEEFGYSF
jgi:hypothetical protein